MEPPIIRTTRTTVVPPLTTTTGLKQQRPRWNQHRVPPWPDPLFKKSSRHVLCKPVCFSSLFRDWLCPAFAPPQFNILTIIHVFDIDILLQKLAWVNKIQIERTGGRYFFNGSLMAGAVGPPCSCHNSMASLTTISAVSLVTYSRHNGSSLSM